MSVEVRTIATALQVTVKAMGWHFITFSSEPQRIEKQKMKITIKAEKEYVSQN